MLVKIPERVPSRSRRLASMLVRFSRELKELAILKQQLKETEVLAQESEFLRSY